MIDFFSCFFLMKRDVMDLETSLAEAKLAVDYFFNNKFVEAKDLMKPW